MGQTYKRIKVEPVEGSFIVTLTSAADGRRQQFLMQDGDMDILIARLEHARGGDHIPFYFDRAEAEDIESTYRAKLERDAAEQQRLEETYQYHQQNGSQVAEGVMANLTPQIEKIKGRVSRYARILGELKEGMEDGFR